MSTDDYDQAVTALAAMIAAWWHDHRSALDPDLPTATPGAERSP
jgi:hypothetical protein